jgi:hypothetical protein
VYFNNKIIHELAVPLGNQTISYAELFAIYSFLIWLRNDYAISNENNSNKNPCAYFHRQYVHVHANESFIPKTHFLLIEDLKNITSFLTDDFDFFIHWIPSHIENTSVGKLPIHGNVHADKLAKLALEQKDPLHKTVVRNDITNIDKL